MTATAGKGVSKRLTFRAGLIILVVCALVAAAVTMGLQTGYAFKNILELWGVVFLGVLAQAVFFDALRYAFTNHPRPALLWSNLMWFVGYLAVSLAVYAWLYSQIGLKDTQGAGVTRDFLTCAYFSVVTWTTLGYGDVLAVEPMARVVAAAEVLNGHVIMAVLIACLVQTFATAFKSAVDG